MCALGRGTLRAGLPQVVCLAGASLLELRLLLLCCKCDLKELAVTSCCTPAPNRCFYAGGGGGTD